MTATDDRAAYLAFKERVDDTGEADKFMAAHEYATRHDVWFPLLRYIAALELRVRFWKAKGEEEATLRHCLYADSPSMQQVTRKDHEKAVATTAECRQALKDAGVDP